MFISGGERSKRAGSPPFFKKCVQTLHGRIDIARSCSTFCFDQIYFIRGDSSKNEPSITFSIVISLKGMSSVIVRAKAETTPKIIIRVGLIQKRIVSGKGREKT